MRNLNDSYTKEGSITTISSFSLREQIEKYLVYWKWFALGIILAITIAWLNLRYSTPVYRSQTTILIKDNKKSGISKELQTFKDLGVVGGSSSNNPDNEIEILRSRRIIGNVVDSLNLHIYYYTEGRIKTSEVYKSDSPIILNHIKKAPFSYLRDTVLNIKILDTNRFAFVKDKEQIDDGQNFGYLLSSSLGLFQIEKNKNYAHKSLPSYVTIAVKPKFSVVDSYRGRIKIDPINEFSSVLSITLQDVIRKKSEDILNELVRQYNLDAVKDKNQISKKTKEFIDERLQDVAKDLTLIDDNVENFKAKKKFIGLPEEATLVLESFSQNNQKIVALKTQRSQADWILNQLKQETTKDDVLPPSLGFENPNISKSIEDYNALIIERKRKKLNFGELNPALLQLNTQIETFKAKLLKSLENIKESIDVQLQQLLREERKISSKISSIPVKERQYIDIARQQQIYTDFYTYLLKKKEETDLSLAITVSNAKIIDVAHSSGTPVSPKRRRIFLSALLLGLLIPFAIVYIKELLDTKIHTKSDVQDKLSAPFLGDIPSTNSDEKIVVGNDVRSAPAEAFRLIRTNLDFMLTSNRDKAKSIFITSTTSGEGKSFISINLAASLAYSEKKVLLIGMDLRAPKVVEYLGLPERKGVTNYITDDSLTLEDITFTIPQIKGLDIISSGVVPPNPSELLLTKRVENLFTIVKEDYDFVIVDTAPVNLVTDTLLLAKYADMVIYTIRANYLDKRLLSVPINLYKEKRVPNMAVVLNDTNPRKSYGYAYGYGKGGYGYGYVIIEKPWYKKIFSRS